MAADTDLTEALVLSDASGNLYVIPRETLDLYKATDEQKNEIEQLLNEDDVAGFAYAASDPSSQSSAATTNGDVLTGSFFNIPPTSRIEGGRSKT